MCQGVVIIPYFVIIYFKSIEFRYRNPSFNLTSCMRFLLCKCIAKAIEKRIQLKFEYFPFWMAFLIVSILLFSIFSSLAIDNISYLSTSAQYNAHFMLNTMVLVLCLHLNSLFYGVAHFLFTVFTLKKQYRTTKL